MTDWKTPQRSATCRGTERPFEEGERIYSVLRITPEGFVREDFSEDWFDRREGRPEDEIMWWRTLHRTERKKGLALDFDAIERLFDALKGRDSERLIELHYVIALLLLRKRRLKMVRVRRSQEGEAMVVRRPRRTEEIDVKVVDLTPERADALRTDLQALFEGSAEGELPDLSQLGIQSGEPEEAQPVGKALEGNPADGSSRSPNGDAESSEDSGSH